jgi:3-hydroxybutyryl-CoA dehydrogenase
MKNIVVIGAGQMGNGIIQVFAINNFMVKMVDINEISLQKGMETIEKNLERMLLKQTINENNKQNAINNISITTDLQKACIDADLIIEAATENVGLKLKIFSDIDNFAPNHCILATNTSSISITKIASITKRPEKVIGMHFMNPVPVMKLVEVIQGYATDKNVVEGIMQISKDLGKIPVEVNDYPGFVANRILMPMINESITTLFENVAGVIEIDTVMKLGMAHPMGPLQLADFIGLDTCLAILRVLHEGFGNQKYAPCPLLVNMVQAGYLGVKSGEGFYKYTKGSKELVVSEMFCKKF